MYITRQQDQFSGSPVDVRNLCQEFSAEHYYLRCSPDGVKRKICPDLTFVTHFDQHPGRFKV